jgi:hypothetical protein
MKILKRILIVVVILIAIPLIVALFVKGDYAIERQTVIKKPKQDVFNYIKYIKNQDNYSVWVKRDPAMKREFKGTDGTVGFISAWDSKDKEVGKGEQEITNIVDGDRMDMKLRFKAPFEATDDAYLTTEAADANQTKVKWGFTGKMPYPFNFMMLFINMDKEVGKDLQQGLDNLKSVLEK